MKVAIYPGTFDPPTLGHLNIIKRAAAQFDNLIIAIGENLSKPSEAFSLKERENFLQIITADIENVKVESFKGLLVDFAREREVTIIIRAIRNIFDFEYETIQAQINRQLAGVETFYLSVEEKYRLISSTLVREIATHGTRLTGFVPSKIEEAIFQHFNNKN